MSDFDTTYTKFMTKVKDMISAQALDNERTAIRWYRNGMKGKIVKRDGVISVESCPPEDDGQLVLHVYPDRTPNPTE